jgi:hypothetical protein
VHGAGNNSQLLVNYPFFFLVSFFAASISAKADCNLLINSENHGLVLHSSHVIIGDNSAHNNIRNPDIGDCLGDPPF